MDWIKQNRFLAGFLGIVGLGVLAFGALFYLSWKSYKASDLSYKREANVLSNLERQDIFPNDENLRAVTAAVADYEAAALELQAEAATHQQPLKEGLTEPEFREQMNVLSEAVNAAAQQGGLSLPDDFALGMESYKAGASINSHAIPLLEWEMQAINRLVTHAIDTGITAIDHHRRDPFAQEQPDWKPEGSDDEDRDDDRFDDDGGDRLDSENPMSTASGVLSTFRCELTLAASYESLQSFLNAIAADDEYFMWPRRFRIENTIKSSPLESDLDKPQQLQGAEEGVLADAQILFGNEQIVANLLIDFVRFEDPAADSSAAGDNGEDEDEA